MELEIYISDVYGKRLVYRNTCTYVPRVGELISFRGNCGCDDDTLFCRMKVIEVEHELMYDVISITIES